MSVDLERRTLEDIDRERASLARGGERVNRREARVSREQARGVREQAEVNRESAESRRAMSGQPPELDDAIDRVRNSRNRARLAIQAVAASEDGIALVLEELAVGCPDRREEYRRAADQAREAAREAREILRAFTQ